MAICLIGGVPVKEPPGGLQIEKYNLTKSGRVATGKMTLEIIAKKRKFNFEYEIMSGADLERLSAIVDGPNGFFSFQYEENGVQKTATVYGGAIKARKFRSVSGFYWKDISFSLIEQ
jgi:hypothetical protein